VHYKLNPFYHTVELDINVSSISLETILWYRGYQKLVDLGLLDFTFDVWTKCYNGEWIPWRELESCNFL